MQHIPGSYPHNITLEHISSNNSGTYHCNKSLGPTYSRNILVSMQHIPGTYPWDTSLRIILGHITATNIWDQHISAAEIYRFPCNISLGHIPTKNTGTYPCNFTSHVVQPPFYILTSVTSSQTCVTCTLPWNFPSHKFTFIWKSLTDLTLKSKNSLSWGFFFLIQSFHCCFVTYCAVVMAPGIIFSFPTCFSRSVTSGRRLSFILACRCTKAEYVCPTANRLDASLMSFKC